MGLKVEHVNKTYGTKKVVNNISFEIDKPSVYGLLGTNGAGKTTTIRMILGILKKDSGEISWNGKEVKRKNVNFGYLPEERGLYVNAVVKDQLLYFAMLNGMDKKAAFTEIKKLLEEFKIPGYLNKKVKTLSKGNKQKIQLISAILHKPQMVILDEPFSGLDPVNIELFKSTVLDLKKSGATILFSSHRMEDVEEMCDRIVMLNKGNVVENNTVQALINKYSREDVMNIVTSADITELIAESGLKLESRENKSFDVQFNDRNKLQHLYARILESGIELQGIRSRKTSLQEIFIKELADNE